ncbi:hypothetical protein BFJ66_g16720 [Fusarium oxysporum f. sp. cepae]|nr:hypothetical protein BFJ66_g16720 [Fusarium oxysporum f. sp. cepae]
MPTAISEPVMTSHDVVPFIIPQELLNAVPRIFSPLVRLPSELLLNLFSHVTDPIDQLCLALTCRRLLQISSSLAVKIPSVSKHKYLPPPLCHGMLSLLRRLAPLDARGRPKRTSALCCDCLRYLPTKKSYWKKEGERYSRELFNPS